MKKIIFTLLSVLLISCSLDSELQPTTPTVANWSLIQSIGGIAGTTSDFQTNQIVWIFDEVNGSLEVTHNTAGVSDALDPGTYNYTIQNIENENFIFINGVEYGAISINVTRFTIDQNITSDGTSVSDKFEYRFAR